MLRLAIARLRIPSLFIQLVINFFSDRYNKVITANDMSDPFKVQIGIDQGKVISPLLWVIYIDLLLTALNSTNLSPYTITAPPSIDSSALCIPSAKLSTLAFIDDTTLVS